MRLVARTLALLLAIGVMLSFVLAGRAYRDLARSGGPLIQVRCHQREPEVVGVALRPAMRPEHLGLGVGGVECER